MQKEEIHTAKWMVEKMVVKQVDPPPNGWLKKLIVKQVELPLSQ